MSPRIESGLTLLMLGAVAVCTVVAVLGVAVLYERLRARARARFLAGKTGLGLLPLRPDVERAIQEALATVEPRERFSVREEIDLDLYDKELQS